MNHISIILRAGCYFLAIVCVNFGKEFVDVGAAKLLAFTWADWAVLAVPTLGNCLIAMVAFFDKSFSEHMISGTSGTSGLTPEDFKQLLASWQPPAKPPGPLSPSSPSSPS